MKAIALLLLLICSAALCQAQSVSAYSTTYKSKEGVEFKVGDRVAFLVGTMPDGSFKHAVVINGYGNVMGNLPSAMSGLSLDIKRFRKFGNKKAGYKILGVVRQGLITYHLDFEMAIRDKEIAPEPKKD